MEEPEPFNFTRDVVEAHALDKRRVALRFVDAQGVIDRRTFDDVAGAAGQWASFLRARGLMPGDRVLVLLGPTAVWPAVLLAVIKAGGVAVPCPEAISNDELELRLRQSGARLLVIDRNRAATLSAVDKAVEVIVCEEVAPDVRGLVTVQPTHDTMMPDPAFILSPAGGSEAHISHRVTRGAILQAERGLDVRPDDLVWCAAETGSATSVWDGLLLPWAAGAAIVIHGAGLDPQQRLDLIHRLGVTVLRQAPDGFRQMTEYPVENGELDSVRRAVAVGGPLDPGVAEAFRSMSGLTVLEETEDKVFERSGSLEAPTVAANGLVDTPNDRVSAATTTPTTNGQADATEVMPPGAAGALGAVAAGSGEVVARDEPARDEAARAKAAAAEAKRVEEERRNAARQEAERHVAERKAAEQRRAEEARRAAEAQAKDDVRRRKEQEKAAAEEARLAERRAEEERKAAAAQAEIDARERKRQEAAAAAAAEEARRAAEAQAKDDVRRRKEQEKEAAKEARLAERRAEEERKAAAAQAEIDARERKRQEAATVAEAQRAAQEARRAAEAQAKEDERRRKEEEKAAAAQARRDEADRRAAAEAEQRRLAEQARADAKRRRDEPRAGPPARVAVAPGNGDGEDEEPDDGPNERLMERLRAYTHHASDATDDPPPQ